MCKSSHSLRNPFGSIRFPVGSKQPRQVTPTQVGSLLNIVVSIWGEKKTEHINNKAINYLPESYQTRLVAERARFHTARSGALLRV